MRYRDYLQTARTVQNPSEQFGQKGRASTAQHAVLLNTQCGLAYVNELHVPAGYGSQLSMQLKQP